YNAFLRQIGCRGLDVLVTNAAETAGEVQKNGVRVQVRVVPNGTPIPDPASSSDRNRLKESLGLQGRDLIIGSIGRLDSNKNHAMLLRSFAPLMRVQPRLRLVIIGDGLLKGELQHMAEQMGIASSVRLTGKIPNAARFLPAMEVCCLSSRT